MNRLEWQQCAERWLADAKALLDSHRWAAAYYLAGYAVECGLKACVLSRLSREPDVIFEDRRYSEKCWTHDLGELVKLAAMELNRTTVMTANRELAKNWVFVKDWKETTRYEAVAYHKAKKLYSAITDKPNGVMQWIRDHW